LIAEAKHRGFAFVTYGSAADAQDAIDNMDLNEMKGRVLKVNLARPMKNPAQLGGNRAGMFLVADATFPNLILQY
jgi:peptidyl-prolyl isomerase E (cyclophilin E)